MGSRTFEIYTPSPSVYSTTPSNLINVISVPSVNLFDTPILPLFICGFSSYSCCVRCSIYQKGFLSSRLVCVSDASFGGRRSVALVRACCVCSEHQRSKSADNLTMRQLTKDDEKVLRRFVDPRHYREVGYDSDKTDLRSFHDAASQDIGGDQIFKALGLGPLPPTPPQAPASTGCERKHGHHSLREKMHLDGLVPCRPTLCRDESDDYAELDDVVGAGMGAEAGHVESDGFDVAGTFLVHPDVAFALCF